jgi:hypothetical protein
MLVDEFAVINTGFAEVEHHITRETEHKLAKI